jgi:hypothetical protein
MASDQTDLVKQQVAAHWGRRAPHFDEDFGHSIRTPAERAAWNRILDLIKGEIETLLTTHGLVDVGGDSLLDLVAAQEQRMVTEGRERRTHRRYAVGGDVPR